MDLLRLILLMAATLAMGLMAGTVAVFAHSIMPGLRRTDDRTFVGAFQAIDRAIMNPWFLAGCFLGALVLTFGAAVAHVGRDAFAPSAVAFVLYLITFVITLAVNVPLNETIQRAGDPDRIADLAAVRSNFNEARWTSFNLVRLGMCLTSFGLLAWALALQGRSP